MKSIRVLVVDDHDLVRAGIRALLQKCADVDVIAEASDGRQALRQLEAHRPDVVLMDIMMPELNGLETTARIARDYPESRVLILSMNAAEEFVLQAIRLGATGYLLKNARPSELEQAVRAVARGEPYLSSAIGKHVIDDYRRRVGTASTLLERLPSRQREVLQLIAEGHTTKEIAKNMGITVKTAETYRTQLMEALNIHDVAGLTRYAIATGVIQLPN